MLSIRNLGVRYGPVTAVEGFDLDVDRGQIVGLIGPNGAGKTSLIDAITGFTPCTGSVRFDDVEIGRLPAHGRARLGLTRTWQSLELFDDLTVLENLMVAMSSRRGPLGQLRSSTDRPSGPEEVLRHVGLSGTEHLLPTQLSQGQRKLLGLARTLVTEPRVLLADEPAAGLDTAESLVLGERLRRVAAAGVGILLVDHDMGLVLSICDYLYVIDFGAPLAAGTPAAIRQNPAVIAAYLGEDHGEASDVEPLAAGDRAGP